MSSSSMIWSVRLIEPAPGCFVTVRNTAGWALSEALPISGVLEPIEMSAMSLSITGASPPLITALPISSASAVEREAFMRYSLP